MIVRIMIERGVYEKDYRVWAIDPTTLCCLDFAGARPRYMAGADRLHSCEGRHSCRATDDGSELAPEFELELPKDLTPRFDLMSASREINLLHGLSDGEIKPLLTRTVDFDGVALITMDHDFFLTALENKKFLEYLDHEEFDEQTLRDGMGLRPRQHERFARAFKTLIRAGVGDHGVGYKHVLGQKIEIVLQNNPYQLDPGETLGVKVLFDGKPLADALVKAFNRDAEGHISEYKARTNAEGITQFTLDKPGVWLLRLVRLQPCVERSAGDCEGIDWESYWTSYPFELD